MQSDAVARLEMVTLELRLSACGQKN